MKKSNQILIAIHIIAMLAIVIYYVPPFNRIGFMASLIGDGQAMFVIIPMALITGAVAYASSYKALMLKLIIPVITTIWLYVVSNPPFCTSECYIAYTAAGSLIVTVVFAVILSIATFVSRTRVNN